MGMDLRLVALAFACALCAAPAGARGEGDAPGARPDSSWGALLWQARAAIEMGDGARAHGLLDELVERIPQSPVPAYLRARLFEGEGSWKQALETYRPLLGAPRASLTADWIRLLSGRWVRASWERDEAELRAARESPLASTAGRCLIFPLEPLILGETASAGREELRALGIAASAWISAALAPRTKGEVLSLHSALRLLGGARPQASALEPLPGGETIPPITTLQGVARRLAGIAPKAAPPWAAGAPVAGRYFPSGTTTPSADAVARALSHFQSEHDLVPTGILDPETRVALERAYREAQVRQAVPAAVAPGADPLRAAAARLGAEMLLTGTLEPLASGDLRWNAAWVAVSDGALLSEPIAGLLPAGHFAEAWALMVRRAVEASPILEAAGAFGPPAPEPLGREAALAYGQAVSALESGEIRDAVRLFRRSAGTGGGSLAEWSEVAWGVSPEGMDRLERSLLREAILGPRQVSLGDLCAGSLFLARGLFVPVAARRSAAGDWSAGQTLPLLPFRGWLEVTGSVEAP